MEMKSEEAYEVKKELDEFIKKYNVTTEQLEEFTDSGCFLQPLFGEKRGGKKQS